MGKVVASHVDRAAVPSHSKSGAAGVVAKESTLLVRRRRRPDQVRARTPQGWAATPSLDGVPVGDAPRYTARRSIASLTYRSPRIAPHYRALLGPTADLTPDDAILGAIRSDLLQPPSERPTLARVEPGRPAESFVVHKLDGAQCCAAIDYRADVVHGCPWWVTRSGRAGSTPSASGLRRRRPEQLTRPRRRGY
jgi:hypothetical protein